MHKIIVAFFFIHIALSCKLVQNQKPLIDTEPKLLAKTTNGQKFVIGDPTNVANDYLYIANLKGTPREMGKALGQLFANQIRQTVDLFYGYYLGQLQQIIQKQKIPAFIAKKVGSGVKGLLNRILDLNIRITKKYTNKRYYDQIKGIAEGSKGKVSFKQIARLNLFPELIKAACTVAGVWGKASANGHTLHVRGLDWDSSMPISKNPILIVYHPSDPKLHVHGNFAWGGFIGSMTGISQKISLGQKVWYPNWDHSQAKMTRYGNPWTYVFRDLLYEAHDLKSAIELLTNTHRTCAIHIGLGSVEDHSFRMFQYSQNILNNYDDKNYTNYGANHPKRQGITYFDKFVQPSSDNCVGSVLTNTNYYGKWDAESLFRVLGLSHETGDTHLIVFDLQAKLAYVAYSTTVGKVNIKAYYRSPIKVDLGRFFSPF